MVTGQTIAGKYRLNRQLGAGGMASVWSATNVFTERQFAIKFMLPQIARTPEAAARFLLEAKVSARINHPNIIEVIDVGQAEDGSLFLVMELLAGVSLEVAMRRQRPPMTVHEFMLVMRDVASALAAAHRSGVVHRDLKPSNVFLHEDRDGLIIPKVLDFGVSKILEQEQSTSLTMDGTVLGSPHYMSPEQAMGTSDLDGRSDVFAFGGILFEALVGERPYDAPNFNALIVTIATRQPKRIDDAAPHLPESLRSLVRDCLVTDRGSRPASFDPIVDRINAMLGELEGSGLTLPGVPSVEPQVTVQLATVPPASSPPASSKTDATFAGLQAFGTFVRALPARTLVAIGAGGLLVVGMTLSLSRRGAPAPARAETPRSAAASVEPWAALSGAQGPGGPPGVPVVSVDSLASAEAAGARARAPGDVPIISVDSLPVASRKAAKKTGQLSITASPGWCSVSIDGVARGVTPVEGMELAAGPHTVECVPPGGKPQSARVKVAPSSAAHVAFSDVQ